MKMNQNQGIYDARQLGRGKMFILGVQHMFAMFGATVLVPALTGLSVSATLLFAGLGTLLFHLLTKRMVPAFLGSSFAFIGGYAAVAPMLEDGTPNKEMLQPLGQGPGEDYPHPSGSCGFLCGGRYLPAHRHAHYGFREAPGSG